MGNGGSKAADFRQSPGANTSELVAKSVVVLEEPLNLILSDKIVRLRIPDMCSKKFLCMVNNHADYARSYYAEEASGTSLSMKNVSRAVILGLAMPLPPLTEQHRIVAKVEELLALCHRLEAAQAERESRRGRLVAASLQRLNEPANAPAFREHARFHLSHLPHLTTRPDHFQQLRQTILNLAARGKLVEQDPKDEPVTELLKRIQTEKQRLLDIGKIKRLQPLLSIEAGQFSSPLPDCWHLVRLGDLLLGDSQNGYSKKPDDAIDGIPILRISAGTMRNDGIVAEEEHKLIGGVSPAQQEQYELQPGDLLACRFNGNRRYVGRLSLYLGYLGIKPIYPDKLIRLRLLSTFVLPKLVRYFAESGFVLVAATQLATLAATLGLGRAGLMAATRCRS
jgi:type I restriction enzyme, S subunit